jgi:hypothetical protein
MRTSESRLRLDPRRLDRARDSFDPFAGDDEAWAPEDFVRALVDDARRGTADHVEFYRTLLIVMVLCLLAWIGIGAAAALAVHRLLGG